MKKTINILLVLGLLATVLGSTVSSAYAMSDAGKGGGGNKGRGSTVTTSTTTPKSATGVNVTGTTATTINATGSLSEEEKADLIFMREEEKLARDVYLTLYNLWGVPTFNSIAASEQNHTDSIANLLSAYGIADPVTDNTVGVFTNPELQALYNDLVATGSASLVDALKVGAAIEEIDILDLYDALARTDEASIQQVYNSLLAGSENHLRGFVSSLSAQGVEYTPQYLNTDTYNTIISSSTGGQQGQSSGGNGGNGSSGRGGRR